MVFFQQGCRDGRKRSRHSCRQGRSKYHRNSVRQNGKQRCQETAKSFVGAMLPGADAEVELNVEFDADLNVGIWMVYASVAQLRAESPLSYKNPPVAEQVKLRGLKANADGLYTLADVEARFAKAIAAYDSL